MLGVAARPPPPRRRSLSGRGWLALYFVVFSRREGHLPQLLHERHGAGDRRARGHRRCRGRDPSSRSRVVALVAAGVGGADRRVQWGLAGRTPTFHAWARPRRSCWSSPSAPRCSPSCSGAVGADERARPSSGSPWSSRSAGLLIVPGAWALSETDQPRPQRHAAAGGPSRRGRGPDVRLDRLSTRRPGSDAQLALLVAKQAQWREVGPGDGERHERVRSLEAQYGLSIMALGGFLGRTRPTRLSTSPSRWRPGRCASC